MPGIERKVNERSNDSNNKNGGTDCVCLFDGVSVEMVGWEVIDLPAKWISVKDRLPKKWDLVITLLDIIRSDGTRVVSNSIQELSHQGPDGRIERELTEWANNNLNVTHWIEFPTGAPTNQD